MYFYYYLVIPVDLTPFLVEEEHKPESLDECEQADITLKPYVVEKIKEDEDDENKPKNLHKILPEEEEYIPAKTGVDIETQVEIEDGLFNFDMEVDPLLYVVTTKVMEQSVIEVNEEEEMKTINARVVELNKQAEEERQRIIEMEKRNILKYKEKEKLKHIESGRVDRERILLDKVMAKKMGKEFAIEAREDMMKTLEAEGYFVDIKEVAVAEDFMPWLYENIQKRLSIVNISRLLLDNIIKNSIKKENENHRKKLKELKELRELLEYELKVKLRELELMSIEEKEMKEFLKEEERIRKELEEIERKRKAEEEEEEDD